MRILAVGDIVGRIGLQKLKEVLPKVVKENNIDFVTTTDGSFFYMIHLKEK